MRHRRKSKEVLEVEADREGSMWRINQAGLGLLEGSAAKVGYSGNVEREKSTTI